MREEEIFNPWLIVDFDEYMREGGEGSKHV